MQYDLVKHYESYLSILESILKNHKNIKNEDIEVIKKLYKPVKKTGFIRKKICEESNFINSDVVKSYSIPNGFNEVEWSDYQYDAICLSNAVLDRGAIISDNYLYMDVVRHDPSLKNYKAQIKRPIRFESIDLYSMTAYEQKSTPIKILENNCFIFNSFGGTHNFGHFLHDMLIQICLFDFVLSVEPNTVPVVCGEFRYPIMKEIFRTLVNKEYKTVKKTEKYQFSNVIIPRRLGLWFDQESKKPASAVKYLHKRIKNAFPTQKNKNNELLYISRKDGLSDARLKRGMANIQQVESTLSKYGFREIVISNMEEKEIIEVFSNAKIIIGLHGAGLMNYIFSSEKTTLIEIGLPISTPPSIGEFCKNLDMKYKLLEQEFINGSWQVSCEQLSQCFSELGLRPL